jgi:hypothetical protein
VLIGSGNARDEFHLLDLEYQEVGRDQMLIPVSDDDFNRGHGHGNTLNRLAQAYERNGQTELADAARRRFEEDFPKQY